VEGRTRKAENEYKRAVAAHPGKVTQWEASCVATLEKAVAAARKGKMPHDHYVRLPSRPGKPSEGRALCNLRRMLATLKMGADDTILLSQEDADAYFGPCTL
jgi:hypothetical protein